VISTRGLVKRYGSLTAVDHVDLDVRPGDIYGFLGANGSGKTTTVRMLLGLVLATEGEIKVLGAAMPASARAVLPRVGALVEGPAAYGHLSGPANLMLADASGAAGPRRDRGRRVAAALERVGLGEAGKRPVKAYSLGMRQRLGLATALLHTPELLILDEPTNGLDPQGIREIRDLLLELNAQGTTIFLSSHLLAEVEQLCTRVGVLDRGRLVVQDQLEALTRPTGNTLISTPDVESARYVLGERLLGRVGSHLVVAGADGAALNAELVNQRVRIAELIPQRRSLEEVVLEMTASR
jgi:ABC-2 type transport system ATP-binding protein